MRARMSSRTLRRRGSLAALLGLVVLVAAGCGSGTATPPGLTIAGPGLGTGKPVPLPANIGVDAAKGPESSMHTHDRAGIIHMEAPHPYNYTLGDFFSVWGVKFGPAQVGGLKGYGGDHLHFYLNGRPLSNPAALLLHKGDSVVIGYSRDSSFPHKPGTILLTEVEKGEAGLGCGAAKAGHHAKPCLATKPTSTARSSGTSRH
jgi:hypothetical protein